MVRSLLSGVVSLIYLSEYHNALKYFGGLMSIISRHEYGLAAVDVTKNWRG